MQRRIWLVLAFVLLILTGLYFFPFGLCNVVEITRGASSRSNYPGTLFASPAWLALLPFSIVATLRRRVGGRLCLIAGAMGAFGSLTMPCAWEAVNRHGLLSGTLLSIFAGALGYWISRQPKIEAL
jgi:hypothetical protein